MSIRRRTELINRMEPAASRHVPKPLLDIDSWFSNGIADIARFGIDSIAGTAGTDGIGIDSVGIVIGVLIWAEILLLPSIYYTFLFA